MNQQLILVRGIPGEGKTTFCEKLVGLMHYAPKSCIHLEADQWRDRDGDRQYDYNTNWMAHAWCQNETYRYLTSGYNVLVANVFCEINKLKPYFDIAKLVAETQHIEIDVTVLHVEGNKDGNSVHDGVNYKRYRENWEDYNGEYH